MKKLIYIGLTAIVVYMQAIFVGAHYYIDKMLYDKASMAVISVTIIVMIIVFGKEFYPMTRKIRTRLNLAMLLVLGIPVVYRIVYDVSPMFSGR